MSKFTHLNDQGQARMVDVGSKAPSDRMARASARIVMNRETIEAIRENSVAKGDVLSVARVAGITGAKQTPGLIPLCHGLPIDAIEVGFDVADEEIHVHSTVRVHGKTGVEMEALTAVSIAALTIYDMCKSMDRGIVVSDIRLEEKLGGKSGHYRRKDDK